MISKESALRILAFIEKERESDNAANDGKAYSDYEYRDISAYIAKKAEFPTRYAWMNEIREKQPMNPIMNSLKSRLAWYEKALAMITCDSPWENGFGWPIIPGIPLPIGSAREVYLDQYIMYLSGCIHELHNTIDMLNAKEESSCLTPNNP